MEPRPKRTAPYKRPGQEPRNRTAYGTIDDARAYETRKPDHVRGGQGTGPSRSNHAMNQTRTMPIRERPGRGQGRSSTGMGTKRPTNMGTGTASALKATVRRGDRRTDHKQTIKGIPVNRHRSVWTSNGNVNSTARTKCVKCREGKEEQTPNRP